MKLTLIRIPALLSVILLSSQIVLAADPVPKFDTGPICRSAGATEPYGRRMYPIGDIGTPNRPSAD